MAAHERVNVSLSVAGLAANVLNALLKTLLQSLSVELSSAGTTGCPLGGVDSVSP